MNGGATPVIIRTNITTSSHTDQIFFKKTFCGKHLILTRQEITQGSAQPRKIVAHEKLNCQTRTQRNGNYQYSRPCQPAD